VHGWGDEGTNVLFVPPKVLKFFLVPPKKFSLYFDISFILKDKRISLYFDPLFIGVFLFQFDCLRVKRAPIKIKNKKLTHLNQNFGSVTAYAVMYLYKFIPLLKILVPPWYKCLYVCTLNGCESLPYVGHPLTGYSLGQVSFANGARP